MPMPRSFGSSQVTFLPLMKIWPSDTSSRPAMQLSRVDLPQPDGPSSTRNSPSPTSRLSRFSTDDRPEIERQVLDGNADALGIHADQPFTAPAAMPRTNSLAGDEIDDERHEARQDRCGHVDVVFLHALHGVDDVVELHRHRIGVRPGVDDAEQEVVPDAGDLQDDGDDEDRQRHRQHDLEVDAPEAGAVDARRLEQLLRHRGEIVAEQQRQDRHAEDGMHDDEAPEACRRGRSRAAR